MVRTLAVLFAAVLAVPGRRRRAGSRSPPISPNSSPSSSTTRSSTRSPPPTRSRRHVRRGALSIPGTAAARRLREVLGAVAAQRQARARRTISDVYVDLSSASVAGTKSAS